MAATPPVSDPNWLPPTARRGMSGTKKLLLGLGIGCGTLLVLCCGGGGVISYLAVKSMKASDAPNDVVALTRAITDIAIPAGLEPVTSFRLELSWLGHWNPSIAIYENKSAGATLLLAQSEFFRAQPPADIRQVMEPMLRQQGGELPSRNLTGENFGTHEVTIRGERVTFTIVEGSDAKTKTARIRATGKFPGKTTTAVLLLDADVGKLSKSAVIAMIDSIH